MHFRRSSPNCVTDIKNECFRFSENKRLLYLYKISCVELFQSRCQRRLRRTRSQSLVTINRTVLGPNGPRTVLCKLSRIIQRRLLSENFMNPTFVVSIKQSSKALSTNIILFINYTHIEWRPTWGLIDCLSAFERRVQFILYNKIRLN